MNQSIRFRSMQQRLRRGRWSRIFAGGMTLALMLACLGRAGAQPANPEETWADRDGTAMIKFTRTQHGWQASAPTRSEKERVGWVTIAGRKYVVSGGLLGVIQGPGLVFTDKQQPGLRAPLQARFLQLDDQQKDEQKRRIVRVVNPPAHLFEVSEDVPTPESQPRPSPVNGQPRPAPDGPSGPKPRRPVAGPVGYGWATAIERSSDIMVHIVLLWEQPNRDNPNLDNLDPRKFAFASRVVDFRLKPEVTSEGLKVAMRNLDPTTAVERLRAAGIKDVTMHRIPGAPAGMAGKFVDLRARRVAVTNSNPHGIAVDLYYYERQAGQQPPTPVLPTPVLPTPTVPSTPAQPMIPVPANPPVADQRNHWTHTTGSFSGSFVHVRGMSWEERDNKTGQVTFRFEEKSRNADYIELFDGSRAISVRLYATKMMLHGPQFAWHDYYVGQWRQEANAPARQDVPPPVPNNLPPPVPAQLPPIPPPVQLPAGPGNVPPVANPGGKSFAGHLSANDPRDRVREGAFAKVHTVELQAGAVYVINLSSPRGPEFFDVYLRIEDADGRHLAHDDDSGGDLNSRLEFRPNVTGTYRLLVTSYGQGATGSYTLNVSGTVPQIRADGPPPFHGQAPPPPVPAQLPPIPPPVQLPAGPGNAPAVANPVGKSFAGHLTANDPRDRERQGAFAKVHTVELQAGVGYVIDLASADGFDFFDVYLRLQDANGRTLTEDDDSGGGLNSRILFRPTASGTYRLVVTSFQPGATGNYSLHVRPAGPQDRMESLSPIRGDAPPLIDQLPPGFPPGR